MVKIWVFFFKIWVILKKFFTMLLRVGNYEMGWIENYVNYLISLTLFWTWQQNKYVFYWTAFHLKPFPWGFGIVLTTSSLTHHSQLLSHSPSAWWAGLFLINNLICTFKYSHHSCFLSILDSSWRLFTKKQVTVSKWEDNLERWDME